MVSNDKIARIFFQIDEFVKVFIGLAATGRSMMAAFIKDGNQKCMAAYMPIKVISKGTGRNAV